jgi:hypothetical protein
MSLLVARNPLLKRWAIILLHRMPFLHHRLRTIIARERLRAGGKVSDAVNQVISMSAGLTPRQFAIYEALKREVASNGEITR